MKISTPYGNDDVRDWRKLYELLKKQSEFIVVCSRLTHNQLKLDHFTTLSLGDVQMHELGVQSRKACRQRHRACIGGKQQEKQKKFVFPTFLFRCRCCLSELHSGRLNS